MSAVKEFNSLGGKVVSRNQLEALQTKAFDEQSFEVHKRVSAILNNHPNAKEFEFEKNSIKKINEKSSLGIPVKLEVYSKQIGKDLVFFYGERKLATIRPNGLIEYETNKFPRGAKTRIRHASSKVGLNAPFDEDMLHGLELLPDGDSYGLGKPVSQKEIYDYVTNLIINTIKEVGHLPWQKEWVGSGSDGEAKNYVTKKPYNGINFILLNFDIKKGKDGKYYLVPIQFEQPYYLTFNQIEEAKATLKKGSSARRVIYYTMVFTYDDGDLQFSTSDKAKFTAFIKENGLTAEKLDRYSYKVPVVKYYNVYRADDCTGLKFPEPTAKPTATPIEQAQEIIDGFPNPPKYTFVGSVAAYYPLEDKINMPKIQAFNLESSYYCTFFHEMIHSTGHEKRLNRFQQNQKKQKDRKKEYAFEELVAELGAVFLCSEAGILFTTIENSAKYLRGWNSRLINELENDNRFFFKASAQAQKAATYILNIDGKKVAKKETKKPKTETKTTKKETKKPKSVKKPVKKVVEYKIDKKKFPLKMIYDEIPSGTKVRIKKDYINSGKLGIVKIHNYAKIVKNYDYPFETQIEFLDGTVDWIKPWAYEKVIVKPKTSRKKPIKKSALANPEPIVEEIEVIEPNPIIPIAVELPSDKTEVLDQENIPAVVEPVAKTNLNPNSLAARKNKNTQPREFYIIENPHIAKLLGNIEKKVKESVAITIAGGQGSGKSSFIFQLIEEFSKNYRVGHASIEEHPESSLYEKKAERYWSEKAFNTVDAPEIKTIEDLDALIKRNDVIVIDSFSKLKSMDKRLTLDDGLRKKYDNKLFIIIYQLTTNNTMRGGSDSQFDGDTILFVEKFPDFNENYVYVDKNRYATDISPDLKYNISQQKIIEETIETEEIEFSNEIETI